MVLILSLGGTEAVERENTMADEKRDLKVGDHVIYTDSHRKQHEALVTIVWPNMMGDEQSGCNLVYVVDDESRDDQYGRQIERETSVVHRSYQPAGGVCWHRPDE